MPSHAFFLDIGYSSSLHISTSVFIESTSRPCCNCNNPIADCNKKHLRDDVSDMCASSLFSAKGRSGEGVCLAFLSTEAFVPSGPREQTHTCQTGCRIIVTRILDEKKRSFLGYATVDCEVSDLGRGMFEVAPRSAVVTVFWKMEERQGHL